MPENGWVTPGEELLKLLMTLFITGLMVLSCNKLGKKSQPGESPPGLPSPQKIAPDQFSCTENSPPLVRYNKDTREQEYCNLGTWTQIMPPGKLPKVLKATAASGAKRERTASTTKKEREKLPRDPNAWRCKSSKNFNNSYLCQLSRP